MIKEKYTQLLLSHQIRGITTIDDTHKLQGIKEELQLYIIKLNQKRKNDKNELSRYYLED